jgi:oligoribonuclease NrnB/cAMP/cGMP phosphodiesterase (DHH superfamily)
MICIHHNDLDGRCSAAIVKYFCGHDNVFFIESDYNGDLTRYLIYLRPNTTVFIVDFSLKPEVMQILLDQNIKPVWIDHHATAKDYPYQFLPGHRNFEDKAQSGCELTWEYFTQEDKRKTPLVVRLIGDYDKWALKMQPQCFEFYEGLKLENKSPESDLWPKLFNDDNKCYKIIEAGKAAIKYRDNYCSDICKGYGYEVEFEGYKAYAVNMYRFGSKQFGERFNQYPLCIAYIHDGSKYVVSLYSTIIDVGTICRKYGGGGHRGAAGFDCLTLPFTKI